MARGRAWPHACGAVVLVGERHDRAAIRQSPHETHRQIPINLTSLKYSAEHACGKNISSRADEIRTTESNRPNMLTLNIQRNRPH